MKKSYYLVLSGFVLLLDQLSKRWIELHFAEYESRPVIDGLLNLTHVRNRGVAFGLFSSLDVAWAPLLLSLLGGLALGIVVLYFLRTPKGDHRLLAALALILGGAVGNLVDRVSKGAVTDFIDFYFGTYHWHTFNVADSAITVGIVLMALDLFLTRDTTAEPVRE